MPELKIILVFLVILAVIVVVAIGITNGSAKPSLSHTNSTSTVTTTIHKNSTGSTTILYTNGSAKSSFEAYLQKFINTKNILVNYVFTNRTITSNEYYYKLWNSSKLLLTSGNPQYFGFYYQDNISTYCETYGSFNGQVLCVISNMTNTLDGQNILIPKYANQTFLNSIQITDLGSNSVNSNNCELFKLYVPSGKYWNMMYNSIFIPKTASGTMYTCMSSQYGYPLFMNESYTYHSNLSYINNTVQIMSMYAQSTGYGTVTPKDLVIPAVFTITNTTNCTQNYIKFNITPFQNLSRPTLYTNYGYYNKSYVYNTINQSDVLNQQFKAFKSYREDLLAYEVIPYREIITFCNGGYCLSTYCDNYTN